jgi:hypothetical protein
LCHAHANALRGALLGLFAHGFFERAKRQASTAQPVK